MTVRHYRDLIVWQKAMDFVVAVYKACACFPREELFGLTAQVRKAAVSVPSNIAEGQGRDTTRDFLHFLSIARGSLQEVETQLLLAERFAYVNGEETERLLGLSAEVIRLINGLCKSLEAKI
ncbi:MAG TPA: four helix bundle protein [Gemmataceae bacterium]|nr:four helix bundle protein [Gemmataceae bacterium]